MNRLRDQLPTTSGPCLEALNGEPLTSIRVNPAKPSEQTGERVPWCSTGYYLQERPVFTTDPLLHAGCYYVQEASSMVLEQALQATGLLTEDITALDLCAAPGGKSTLIRSLLTTGSLLVANEVVPARRKVLCENLWKWGAPNVVITGTMPERFRGLTDLFDLILVDAPCSGEGMFRKDPYARQQWTPGLVEQCARLQSEILAHAWACLRPGGLLVYSTCTWSSAENEAQLTRLLDLGATPISVELMPEWGFSPSAELREGAWRAYPHQVRGEGFFFGVLRKPGDRPRSAPHPGRSRSEMLPVECTNWTLEPDGHCVTHFGDTLHTVDRHHAQRLHQLMSGLHMEAPGIPLATWKGGRWRPHPAWALNSQCRTGAFPSHAVDQTTAQRYLKGEVLRAPGAHGTALLTHAGHPLGWLHGAGNRWNNPWPPNWRIRMQVP